MNNAENLSTAQFDHLQFLKHLQDTRSTIPDIHSGPFLRSMKESVKMFNVIGSVISFAFKDITSKIDIIQRNYRTFPDVKGGLISFIEFEKNLKLQRLNGENPQEAPEPQYKNYESTTRTVLRLMWFLDFISALIEHVEQNRNMKVSDCCKKAYDETLGPHHPLPVRMAAKAAMSFTPSREKFLRGLFPGNLTDEEKYMAFKRCIENISPIKESLWDYYSENNLKDLP